MGISRTAGLSSQCQQVNRILRSGGSLTTLEAMKLDPPICRLSERIRELEIYYGWDGKDKQESPIIHKRESHGKKHYIRYSLKPKYLPKRISVNDYLNEQARLFV